MATAQTIPVARVEMVNQAVRNFVGNFETDISSSEFLASYHPDVEWFDHAFHVCRVGRDAVAGLKKSFLHCNQPFKVEIKVRRNF